MKIHFTDGVSISLNDYRAISKQERQKRGIGIVCSDCVGKTCNCELAPPPEKEVSS